MAITNITKTGGTIASPIISAFIDNVQFSNIPSGGKGTKGSTFWNPSSNANVWKDGGDGTQWNPSVNAVDINWNGAELELPEELGGTKTINTTGQLFRRL